MWTADNPARYDRSALRYPSHLTDEEWSHTPPVRGGGRKREVNIREVVKGVMYVLSTGCDRQYLPKDLPLKSTVHSYFAPWDCDGTLRKTHARLRAECREQAARETSPSAGVIDSQSMKSAKKGGPSLIRMAMTRGGRGISSSIPWAC